MEHSVSSRTGERSRPALLVSAVLALLVALTTLLAPGLASPASAADATANPVKPTLSGTARVGQTLTLDRGLWSPTGATLTVKWFRGTTEIPGAAGDTYVLTAADQGQEIFARVAGSATLTEDTAKVSPVAECGPLAFLGICEPAPAAKSSPTNSVVPTITPTDPKVGVELTAASGTWSETVAPQYQWYTGSGEQAVAIAGANGEKFTPTTAEQGKKLTVKVWGTSTAGLSGTAVSVASAEVGADPNPQRQIVAVPTINRTTPKVGDMLTAAPGTFAPDATGQVDYQWLAGDEIVSTPGRFPFELVVTSAMLNKPIRVAVTARKTDTHAATTAFSVATAPVQAADPGTNPGANKVEPAMTVNVKVKRSGKVVVKAKVTAAGHSPVTGQAKVKVTRGGGKAVTVDLVNGKVKLSWAKLKKGKHKAKVTYLGNDKLAATPKVVVPFTKR